MTLQVGGRHLIEASSPHLHHVLIGSLERTSHQRFGRGYSTSLLRDATSDPVFEPDVWVHLDRHCIGPYVRDILLVDSSFAQLTAGFFLSPGTIHTKTVRIDVASSISIRQTLSIGPEVVEVLCAPNHLCLILRWLFTHWKRQVTVLVYVDWDHVHSRCPC